MRTENSSAGLILIWQMNEQEAHQKGEMIMKKYLVEFGFAENFVSVVEWQTIDGLDAMEAENAEEAAN